MPNSNNQSMIKKSALTVLVIALFFLNAPLWANVPPCEKPHVAARGRQIVPPKFSYLQKQAAWVDSILAGFSLEQKIGQLFMISTFSNRNEQEYSKIEAQIEKYHLGGLIFFQGTPLKQAELTNRYQLIAQTPLLIGFDGEWGLEMRLDGVESFPKAITLGATRDISLVESLGFYIGRQCKRIGIHINFAPVADINSNPKNPVINYRSFGESAANVASMASAFGMGLKRAGVMGSAKHFPGHGDTGVDSHNSLPVLGHSKKHLDEVELVPFKKMIQDSVASVMVGHLHVPSIDPTPNLPASISRSVITGILKEELHYQGLVITDALNMRGLLRYFPTGEAEVRAFQAGNDLLLQTANIETAFNAIRNRILDSTLSLSDLDTKVRKILMAKYWVGLSQYKPADLNMIESEISNAAVADLKKEIFAKAVTVVKDDEGFIPLKNASTIKYASVAIAAPAGNGFQDILSTYGSTTNFTLPYKPSKASDWKWVGEEASQADIVIVSVHSMHNLESRNFGVVPETMAMIRAMAKRSKLIVCVFGNPYSLKMFDEFETVICGYEDEPEAYLAVANIVFGVESAKGKIPVNTLSNEAKLNDGYASVSLGRLGYGSAKSEGLDILKLAKVDQIVEHAIAQGEFPGGQLVVAKNGKVMYEKSYGNLRYGLSEPVTRHTLYDLASLTKVLATLQATMMLYDQKKLDLKQTLGYYLPQLKGTNKASLEILDVLLHQAGLKAFVPFWAKTKGLEGGLSADWYQTENVNNDLLKVADQLFVKPSIKDSVLSWIAESPLISQQGEKKYVYSDLGLLLMQRVIESITKQPLDVFLDQNLYGPLKMTHLGYNLPEKRQALPVAPTEIDHDYRNKAIAGTVHDPNAALLGGVAGHAGLFGNAWDVAKLLQMNLNKGTYGESRFFSPATIQYFSSRQSKVSHRGIGWNKPTKSDGSVSEWASDQTYGHTGFTGTVAWVDPTSSLIYVFLSNRVYPRADNNLLLKNQTRKKIHDAIYKAMF
jgi:beta-N-acetylhexosaminidase